MLIVTPAASDALDSIATARSLPESGGMRLAFVPDQDGQQHLSMTIVDEPEPQDALVDEPDVSLFLEPDTVPLLDDKVLDVQPDDQGRPNFVLLTQADQ